MGAALRARRHPRRPTNTVRCALGVWLGYVRVSRVGDREETLISPKLQERQIRGWAAGRGVSVEMLPPELDASGGDDVRPILLGGIERVERGERAGIIVAKFDRLSRSMRGQLAMLGRIESAGGQVRSVAEDLDPSTPQGRMTRNILFSVAEGERESKAEELERAKADAIARGVYIAGRVPLGYRRRADRVLEPDPASAPAVRRAFEMRAEGASWRGIADFLAEALGRPFYGPAAARMIRNPAYLGLARQGRHRNEHAHEPLVGRVAWEAAQRSQPRHPRGAHGPALLGGIIRCAGCSWRMTNTVRRVGREYRCRRRGARGVCASPAIIAASVVEPIVVESVLRRVEDLALEEPAEQGGELAAAQQRLAEALAERDAFLAGVEAAGVSREHFADALRLRVEAVEQAHHELAAAQAAAEPLALGTGREVWSGLSVEERAHVLRGSLSVVWVRRGRGAIDRVRLVDRTGGRGLSRQGKAAEPVALDWRAPLVGEIEAASAVDLGDGPGEV